MYCHRPRLCLLPIALAALVTALAPTWAATPPTVVTQIPPAGSTVPSLQTVEVYFSTAVTNVQASDLLVGGSPAANVMQVDVDQYLWGFAQPPTGTVQVAFSPSQAIRDLAGTPFAGGSWTCLLNTNPAALPVINEFIAANQTNLKDKYGKYSDWIELYNPNTTASFNLLGYHLTGNPLSLTNWTFPAVIMSPRSYLVVFADGSTDTPVAGQELHANFKLNKEGDYLALVAPDGATIIQEFAPVFPLQTNDISYGFISPGILDYMQTPSPGKVNVPNFRVAEVQFSEPSKAFTDSFYLTLSNATPGAAILYTTNGTVPHATNSARRVYSAPILVSGTVQVRARGTNANWTDGFVTGNSYVRLESNLVNFSSDLPLIVLENYGAGGIPQSALQPLDLLVFEPGQPGERTTLALPATVNMRAGLHSRGSASEGYPKKQFKLETWNQADDDEHVALLGLPAESDWVLNGDWQEESLIRNPLMYGLARDMGLEAPGTRFCEVYLHTSGGSLKASDYYGVMVLIEFIKISKNRLNLDSLSPFDNAEPAAAGGYIIRFERGASKAPYLSGWSYLEVADPNTPTSAQINWISTYVNNFTTAVNSPGFRDPLSGYAAYIDVPSFVNCMIHNELGRNQDAYVKSAYLFKPRGGKLVNGPIWDCNLTFGMSCCFNSHMTNGWQYNYTDWNDPPGHWYLRLLQDADFRQQFIDRYQELRRGLLSETQFNARMEALAAQVQEAQLRNFKQWPTLGRTDMPFQGSLGQFMDVAHATWTNHVQEVKFWAKQRTGWMDAQFPTAVTFNLGGGIVAAGTQLAITWPTNLPIYYTGDGRDPRSTGGGVAAGAVRLGSSRVLTLNSNTIVTARSFDGVNWSGPTVAHFYVTAVPASAANLIITEINYHPAAPTPAELSANTNLTHEDFEFIELRVLGSNTVDLYQARFTNGISFTFSGGAVAALAPGQYLLLVKNRAAFELRYGTSHFMAGTYGGTLDKNGERLTLVDWQDQFIADFTYSDAWSVPSDGLGFTLVAKSETGVPIAATESLNWRTSMEAGGSPGAPDPPFTIQSVLVNEILSFPALFEQDRIELFNPNTNRVEIGGWFLTDDRAVPAKYRIPDGTSLRAGGYLVFEESQFNAVPGRPDCFGLSSSGEEVYLFSADPTGHLTGFAHGFAFAAAEQGVTFGRYLTGTGDEQFPAQRVPTLGTHNAGPRVGPVVISEIMYHPPPGAEPFVELQNNTGTNIPLYDLASPTNTWKLAGLGFSFPAGSQIGAQGRALIVGADPVAFRTKYGVPEEVPVFGPFTGSLQHSGELLELQWPRPPYTNGVDYVTMDAVRYNDKIPWPASADGDGPSLQRINPTSYGNDPDNWTGAAPSPGVPLGVGTIPTILVQPASRESEFGSSTQFSVTASGSNPMRYQWSFDGQAVGGATNSTLFLSNLQFGQSGSYSVVVFNAASSVVSSSAALTVVGPSGRGFILINEIMFNSALPNAQYLELFNSSTEFSFDLSGWHMDELAYTFPSGSRMPPRSFLLLARDRTTFSALYGGSILPFDVFATPLPTNGGTLTLVKPGAAPSLDVVIDKVRYENAAPWLTPSNGIGASLQLIDPTQDNSRPCNWSAVPVWRLASYSGGVTNATRLNIYPSTAPGEAYLDDFALVAGTNAAIGFNFLKNAGFENPLPGTWAKAGPGGAASTNSTLHAHTGSNSLHLVFTNSGGSSYLYQSPGTLPAGVYTLSFWYCALPGNTPTLAAYLGGSFWPEFNLRPATPGIFTPGTTNSVISALAPVPPLWINEVQPRNVQTRATSTGRYPPWLELYNAGASATSLSGLYLANSDTNLTQWAFPSNATIAAGEFKIIFCDGQADQSTLAELHTDFRLEATHGFLALVRLQSGLPAVLDYLSYGDLPADEAYGSVPDGQLFDRQTLALPTPGGPNNIVLAPAMVAIRVSGPTALISFPTTPGLRYRAEYKDALESPLWTELAPAQVASDAVMSIANTLSDSTRQRFYRVVTLNP